MLKITKGQGFTLRLPNGWTVSVQIGPGGYHSNRHFGLLDITPDEAAREAGATGSHDMEIYIIDAHDRLVEIPSNHPQTVEAYADSGRLLELLNWAASHKVGSRAE
jgi:hypothetical protein